MKSVSRLYTTFLPAHYDLTLHINRNKRTYKGSVTITGVKPGSDAIRLHAKDLTILSATVDNSTVRTSVHDFDELRLHETVPKGTHTIVVEFSGHITDTMHGLYPCYYVDETESKELLMTQFESHHAREVFPCIDEPEAKASFQLTIETEKNLKVLSNTPVLKEIDNDTTIITQFEPTPRMSTYLLAFVIGHLQKVTGVTKRGVEVSIYATPNHPKTSLTFALDIAVRGIDFFEEYFDIDYPLKKSDHVAVPDFSAGAMENWGMITYKERALLVDGHTSQSSKELVASVICHELSHQWFGNLVTMRWWDDLWLNESFANLMEYVAVDTLEPSWNIWQLFASLEASSALSRDHIAHVQPVKTTVRHPDEISTLFDPAIVYAKGSRLLRMLQTYIGDEAFRKGLHDYFTEHEYSNTSSDDLWRSLSKHADIDVGKLMTKWLAQSGFPLVQLQTTANGYQLSQRRLITGGHDESQLWPIPLASTHPAFPDMLTSKSISFKAAHTLPFLNKGNASHFVTHYDELAFELIVNALKSNKLDTVDRLALLFETSLLARTGTISYVQVLNLLSHYKNETQEPVWSVISFVIADIRRFIENTPAEASFKAFVHNLIKPILEEVGMQSTIADSESMKKLRAVVLHLAVYAEDALLIQTLLDKGRSHDTSLINGELRPVIYSVMARYGNREDFSKLVFMHNDAHNPHLRLDIVDGLTTTIDADHIAMILVMMTDKDQVKPQDMVRWFVGLMRNPHARDETWQWMMHHWRLLTKTFDGDKLYDAFPRYSASTMNSIAEYKSYVDFFDSKTNDPALRRTIEIGQNELKFRSHLIEKESPSIIAALAQLSINS